MTLAIATARSRSPLPYFSGQDTARAGRRQNRNRHGGFVVRRRAAGRGRGSSEGRRRQVVHRQRERPQAREHLKGVPVGHGRNQFLPILGKEPYHHAAGVQHVGGAFEQRVQLFGIRDAAQIQAKSGEILEEGRRPRARRQRLPALVVEEPRPGSRLFAQGQVVQCGRGGAARRERRPSTSAGAT